MCVRLGNNRAQVVLVRVSVGRSTRDVRGGEKCKQPPKAVSPPLSLILSFILSLWLVPCLRRDELIGSLSVLREQHQDAHVYYSRLTSSYNFASYKLLLCAIENVCPNSTSWPEEPLKRKQNFKTLHQLLLIFSNHYLKRGSRPGVANPWGFAGQS